MGKCSFRSLTKTQSNISSERERDSSAALCEGKTRSKNQVPWYVQDYIYDLLTTDIV